MRTRMLVALSILLILLTPLTAPVAAEWEEDSWLTHIIGPERLERGDELGCHGIPGKDIRFEPAAITECRDYLSERSNASKWGSNPLSFGSPDGAWSAESLAAVKDAGFQVVGGEAPAGELPALRFVSDNGGSLEKSIGDVQQFEAALSSNPSNVNLYWRARDHDVVVRPDSELVAAIEATPAWFTTWGELTSYQIHLTDFEVISLENGSWEVTSSTSESAEYPGAWQVPVTNHISNVDADVVSVFSVDGQLAELAADEPHLQQGWRQTGGEFFLTLAPNSNVTVNFDRSGQVNHFVETASHFNGHNLSITVSGIHTGDLFYWSKRWDDTPMLFTWLVEPRDVGAFNWWLPVVAIVVAIVAPVAIYSLVRKDQRARGVVEVFDSLDQIRLEEE